jgi:hypothetical protein
MSGFKQDAAGSIPEVHQSACSPTRKADRSSGDKQQEKA